MTKDIVPELLEKIEKEFIKKYSKSSKINNALKKIKAGKATHQDSNEFASECGKTLAEVFKENIRPNDLPDGKMYYNIADRVLNNALGRNYKLISDYSSDVQTSLNKSAGLRIKGIKPPKNQDRIRGLIERVQEAPIEKTKWVLEEPIVNFSQSIVDDTIRTNAEFHNRLGLKPKIVRKLNGKCCDWCEEVAGEYEYPNVPKDVYRRHRFCRCTVEYFPGDGRKQNVHTKKWADVDKGKNERVETYSKNEREKQEKEKLEKVKRKFLSEYDIEVDDGILELNSEVTLQAFTGIESMFKLYPDLKDQITNIGISSNGIMNCSGKKINFNPTYFSDNEKLQKVCIEMSEAGWWPKNSSPASVAAHEMGHAVNWNLIAKNPAYEYDFERVLDWNDQTTAKEIVSEACKKTKKTEFGKGKKNAELRNSQSKYGATNPSEAIAEAFADLYANESNANQLSKAIVDETNKLFDEYGKGGE